MSKYNEPNLCNLILKIAQILARFFVKCALFVIIKIMAKKIYNFIKIPLDFIKYYIYNIYKNLIRHFARFFSEMSKLN